MHTDFIVNPSLTSALSFVWIRCKDTLEKSIHPWNYYSAKRISKPDKSLPFWFIAIALSILTPIAAAVWMLLRWSKHAQTNIFRSSCKLKSQERLKLFPTNGVLALVGEAFTFVGSGDMVFRNKGTLCGRGGRGDFEAVAMFVCSNHSARLNLRKNSEIRAHTEYHRVSEGKSWRNLVLGKISGKAFSTKQLEHNCSQS